MEEQSPEILSSQINEESFNESEKLQPKKRFSLIHKTFMVLLLVILLGVPVGFFAQPVISGAVQSIDNARFNAKHVQVLGCDEAGRCDVLTNKGSRNLYMDQDTKTKFFSLMNKQRQNGGSYEVDLALSGDQILDIRLAK